MGKTKEIGLLLGLLAIVAGYLTMVYTFLVAYLSGDMEVVVTINAHHEANFELAFLILTLPCVFYFIRFSLRKIGEGG